MCCSATAVAMQWDTSIADWTTIAQFDSSRVKPDWRHVVSSFEEAMPNQIWYGNKSEMVNGIQYALPDLDPVGWNHNRRAPRRITSGAVVQVSATCQCVPIREKHLPDRCKSTFHYYFRSILYSSQSFVFTFHAKLNPSQNQCKSVNNCEQRQWLRPQGEFGHNI